MKKKEIKRFESVAYIMLELMDKAIEMKKLQIDELKIKRDQEHEKVGNFPKMRPTKDPMMNNDENIHEKVKKYIPNQSEKFPVGGIILGVKNNISEFVSPKFGTLDCDCSQCTSVKNAERKGDD